MFGICNVALSPLRKENSDTSEMISQLLFGETFEIIEINNNWSFVKCTHDNYQGWMDTKQYERIEKLPQKYQLSFNKAHACQLNHSQTTLVLGSRLPNFDGLNFKINKDKYIFNGNAIDPPQNSTNNLKKVCLKYLNAPYLWGGRSPFGIDCSGLTQMVYSFFNIELPRDAYMQAELGEALNFVSEAKEGDLAFFGKEEKITHVGIILENQEIIHASGKVRIDKIDHIGIYNKDEKKYTHFLKTIKRIV
ncbi:MAG: C40 family peptidase [Chitinophagales bacterium]